MSDSPAEAPRPPRSRQAGATIRAATLALKVATPILGESRSRWLVVRAWAITTLVLYTLRAQYARALLGVVWTLITPLLFLAVYLPLFTFVFNMEGEEFAGDKLAFPIYVIVGFLLWNAFADGLSNGGASLIMNLDVVRHSPSPPMLLPTVKVGTSFVNFMAGNLLVVVFLAATGHWPGVRLLLFPVAAGLAFVFTWGLALLASSLAVYMRDLLQMINTLMWIEFFACPLLYPISALPEPMRVYVQLNPFTPFLTLTRAALIPTQPIALSDVGLAALWALTAFAAGALTFRRLQGGFGDAS